MLSVSEHYNSLREERTNLQLLQRTKHGLLFKYDTHNAQIKRMVSYNEIMCNAVRLQEQDWHLPDEVIFKNVEGKEVKVYV